MIPFNRAPYTGEEDVYVLDAMHGRSLVGDGEYGKKCQNWFEKELICKKTLLTPSCTHALEMAAILIDIHPDDEVIMPSYTFVSTANAFVLRGAKIVFVDIRPDTMNIDETLIESAITSKTKAVVPVHYAGVACEMDAIMDIAAKHDLYVIEDAAQGMMSTYKGKALGTIGHFGVFSFHGTKNYTSGGEGGLLIINAPEFIERAEIIREKGTNRSLFFRGAVDKYSWVDIGSSYLPSELQAAYLWGQLRKAKEINENRLATWGYYYQALTHLQEKGFVSLPVVPKDAEHNAHMFYMKVQDIDVRTKLIQYLKEEGVMAPFHYVPLHSSELGLTVGRFVGEDAYTTKDSERLFRLPLYYKIGEKDRAKVVDAVQNFCE